MTGTALPDLASLVTALVDDGAEVVWLAGSHARGDPGPYSDVDMGVIAPEAKLRPRAYRLHQAVLVSLAFTTAQRTRASFLDPAQLGAAVPGWRSAVLLHDPGEAGEALKDTALAWAWSVVDDRCNRWVAAELTQLAEELHKLLNALATGHDSNAAIRRNLLVHRLALVMSVHRRILYDSEVKLFDLVADAVGGPWPEDQAKALSLNRESLEESAHAAMRLYATAAQDASTLLKHDQLDVVNRTLELSRAATKADLPQG